MTHMQTVQAPVELRRRSQEQAMIPQREGGVFEEGLQVLPDDHAKDALIPFEGAVGGCRGARAALGAARR